METPCDHKGAGFGYCYQCGTVTDGSDTELETVEELKAEVTRLRILVKDAYFEGFRSPHTNTRLGSVESYWPHSKASKELGPPNGDCPMAPPLREVAFTRHVD